MSNTTQYNEINFYTQIFDNSADAIYLVEVTEDGRFKHRILNQTFVNCFGCFNEAFIDKYVDELDNIDYKEILLEKYTACMTTGKTITYTNTYKLPMGNVIFSSMLTPIYDENGRIYQIIGIARNVTQEKASEGIINLLNKALDSSSESIFLINLEDNTFIYVNDTACNVLGYTREEMINNMTIFDIDPDLTIDSMEKHIQKLLENGHITLEARHKTKDGQTFPIEINSHHFAYNGSVFSLTIARNITEIREFETIFRISRDGIAVLDLASNFLNFNDAYLNMTGFTREELIKKSCIGLSAPDDIEKSKNALLTVKRKGALDYFEKKCIVKDGKEITINMSMALLPDKERILICTKNMTEQKLAEKKIKFLAYHDPLIGLPNRLSAKIHIEKAIKNAQKNGTLTALFYIDLDGFKTINDTLGHSYGDKVLIHTAKKIQSILHPDDLLCRQGGDEFILIMQHINDINEIETLAINLAHTLDESLNLEGNIISTSASIGIAICPEHGETPEILLKNADMAMYQAKNNGKNNFSFFNHTLTHNLIGQFKLQNDLKAALQNKEFLLHYQPKIDLQSNTIVGVEALLRWNHPQLGLIPPMKFIPIAESSGLIVPIGKWIIEEACSQASIWFKQGLRLTIAVNISAIQFTRGNLEEVVSEALLYNNLNPEYLELELTESIIIHDAEAILQTVKNLKALGIQLSIDDFGTGYSSLAYLKRFAVDKLKIDRSFIRDIINNQEDAVIVDTIIKMANNLNLTTIAEGVEDQETTNLLSHLGCNEVQGYYFSKPLSSSDLEQFYSEFTRK